MSQPAVAERELHNDSHPLYTFPLWNEITVFWGVCVCIGACARAHTHTLIHAGSKKGFLLKNSGRTAARNGFVCVSVWE